MKIVLIIIILNLLFIFPSFSNSIEIKYSKINELHNNFCNKLTNNILLKENHIWFIKNINKNKYIIENKQNKLKINIILLKRSKKIQKLIFTFFNKQEKPAFEIRSNKNCEFKTIRKIIYNQKNIAIEIQSQNIETNKIDYKETLNPKLPKGISNNKNIIALIDTGVNYTLPQLHKNIAFQNKKLLGYDFWDNDNFPFDQDPRNNPFYPRHHGTTVFSVLSREAPKSTIAIYRFPALNMCKFKELIEHIAKNSIRIVNLSMGSSNINDWLCFQEAALKNNKIIFVVSAGNNGFDIDKNPIYPASLKLDNIITVTSSDLNGRVGRGSNIGNISIDFMLPAERVEVIDHRGVKAFTGGTSYAAPRLTAMISRLITANPGISNEDILKILKKRSIKSNKKVTKYGWIPDPLDNYLFN
jgi:subtilisin family serine protease|tara:strand:- start:11182 stop:12423 length:1242 start_codon:yes stop_codon:yes gene_type:complete